VIQEAERSTNGDGQDVAGSVAKMPQQALVVVFGRNCILWVQALPLAIT
jgi:hypothetical protein